MEQTDMYICDNISLNSS